MSWRRREPGHQQPWYDWYETQYKQTHLNQIQSLIPVLLVGWVSCLFRCQGEIDASSILCQQGSNQVYWSSICFDISFKGKSIYHETIHASLSKAGTPTLFIWIIHVDKQLRWVKLTHLPLDKMATILKKIFSDAFAWTFCILMNISLKFVLTGPIDNKPALV